MYVCMYVCMLLSEANAQRRKGGAKNEVSPNAEPEMRDREMQGLVNEGPLINCRPTVS